MAGDYEGFAARDDDSPRATPIRRALRRFASCSEDARRFREEPSESSKNAAESSNRRAGLRQIGGESSQNPANPRSARRPPEGRGRSVVESAESAKRRANRRRIRPTSEIRARIHVLAGESVYSPAKSSKTRANPRSARRIPVLSSGSCQREPIDPDFLRVEIREPRAAARPHVSRLTPPRRPLHHAQARGKRRRRSCATERV